MELTISVATTKPLDFENCTPVPSPMKLQCNAANPSEAHLTDIIPEWFLLITTFHLGMDPTFVPLRNSLPSAQGFCIFVHSMRLVSFFFFFKK